MALLYSIRRVIRFALAILLSACLASPALATMIYAEFSGVVGFSTTGGADPRDTFGLFGAVDESLLGKGFIARYAMNITPTTTIDTAPDLLYHTEYFNAAFMNATFSVNGISFNALPLESSFAGMAGKRLTPSASAIDYQLLSRTQLSDGHDYYARLNMNFARDGGGGPITPLFNSLSPGEIVHLTDDPDDPLNNGIGLFQFYGVGGSMLPGFELSGLKVTQVRVFSSSAPEPGTWALMLIGFGLIGRTMRAWNRTGTILSRA